MQEKNNTVIKNDRFSSVSNISEEISENKKYYEEEFIENDILKTIPKERIDMIKQVYPHSINLAQMEGE